MSWKDSSCENCVYAVRLYATARPAECRRFPPTAVIGVYPVVASNNARLKTINWKPACAEHKVETPDHLKHLR